MSASQETQVGPDEAKFRADIEAPAFQAGQDRSYWQLRSIDWPYAVITVTARRRPSTPYKPAFRFRLDGYPMTKPAAQLWDRTSGQLLDPSRWPRGGLLDIAFNPNWNSSAIYLPLDRVGSDGHPAWTELGPSLQWDPEIGIVQYLRFLREMLISDQYVGIRG